MFGKVLRHAKLALFLGLVSALPGQVLAIGLGEIQLNSSLNEPLNAEIKLLQTNGLNENEILAEIAPKADFEAAGVDRLFFLSSLKFSLELDNPKGPLIRIRTDAPVREPYLNFLLEVQWPSGRLLREYTLLMDLPAFAEKISTARVIKGAETPVIADKPKPKPLDVQALEAELAAVDSAAVTTAPAPAVTPVVTSEAPAESSGKPVENTKEAAADTKNDMALQEEKPAAAVEEQQSAAQPAAQQDQAASPQQSETQDVAPVEEPAYQSAPVARDDYQPVVPVYSSTPNEGDYTTQKGDSLWSISKKYQKNDGVTIQQSMLAYQRLNPDAFINGNINQLKKGKVLRMPTFDDLTELTSREAVADVRRQNMEWSGNPDGRKAAPSLEQIDATHQDIAATDSPADVEGGHLKLSVPGATDSTVTGKASGAEASNNVEALQNELSITMEELDRSKREKAKSAAQLTGLDDQTKTMQQMLEVRSAELAALQAELAKKDQATETPVATDQAVNNEQPVETTAETAEPVAVVEEEKATPVTEEVVSQDGGIVAKLLANLVWILGGVATLVLLAFAAIKLRKRKTSALAAPYDDDFNIDAALDAQDNESAPDNFDEESLEDSLDLDSDLVDGSASEAKPETSDAIGEADIYISFGTYDKAESLLKNAIASEPKRTDLRLKLLEVYVGKQDVKAFDTQLAALTDLRDQGAIERAQEMRNKISGSASVAAPMETHLDNETSLDFDTDLADDEISADFDLDLDLDLDLDEGKKLDTTEKSPKVSISDAPTVQQRALDISEMQTAVTPAVRVSEARTESRESIDLDLSGLDAELEQFDTKAERHSPAIESAAVAAVAKDAPTPNNVGLDETFDFLADADESATKLDLARAYIDMGDKEGAKDILQEVIEEGQDAQKDEARKLLAGIS